MAKGENEEDSVIKNEIKALSGNVTKLKVSENTPSKYMAKEEDQALKAKQALCQYPANSENSSVEYIAKGEEEDIKAHQASLNHAIAQ